MTNPTPLAVSRTASKLKHPALLGQLTDRDAETVLEAAAHLIAYAHHLRDTQATQP